MRNSDCAHLTEREGDEGEREREQKTELGRPRIAAAMLLLAVTLLVVVCSGLQLAVVDCGTPGGPPVVSPRVRLADDQYLADREWGVPRAEARHRFILVHGLSGSNEFSSISFHQESPSTDQMLGNDVPFCLRWRGVAAHEVIEIDDDDDPAAVVPESTSNKHKQVVEGKQHWEKHIEDDFVDDLIGFSTYHVSEVDGPLEGLENIEAANDNDDTDVLVDYGYEYEEDDYDDYVFEGVTENESDYNLAAKFDNLDLPPGVEATVPWWQKLSSEKTSNSKLAVNVDEIDDKFKNFKNFDVVQDYSDHYFSKPENIKAAFLAKKLVHYHSGGLRLNPNLYACGKVCLSLLGTWAGNGCEKWRAGKSTMLQVLVSIQALVLNANPYFNEPGYEAAAKTSAGEKKSLAYNEDTFLLSCNTMIYSLRRPPKNFEDFIAGHFRKYGPAILLACRAYMDGAQVGCVAGDGVQDVDEGDKSSSSAFQSKLKKLFEELLMEFTVKGADCDVFLAQKVKAGLAKAKETLAADTTLRL